MRRKRGMFYSPPYNPDLGAIVSIRNPREARASARQLLSLFKKARTRERKVTIKRATVLAANRAEAMLNRRGLSLKERRELKEIVQIYRNAASKMQL